MSLWYNSKSGKNDFALKHSGENLSHEVIKPLYSFETGRVTVPSSSIKKTCSCGSDKGSPSGNRGQGGRWRNCLLWWVCRGFTWSQCVSKCHGCILSAHSLPLALYTCCSVCPSWHLPNWPLWWCTPGKEVGVHFGMSLQIKMNQTLSKMSLGVFINRARVGAPWALIELGRCCFCAVASARR